MVVPEAKQHPVLRRYALRRWKIPVKSGRLSIVCPRAMDDLLLAMSEDDFRRRDERLPYWSEVWASSVAIARLLCRGPKLEGRRVLDLGCGVGVAGSAAHAMGAAVDFADCESDALAFALFNAERNAPDGGSRPPVAARRFDWQRDRLDGTWDLVLMADIVYEPRHHAPLLELLGRALAAGGVALVADPGRAPSSAFFTAARQTFALREELHETWFPNRRSPVRIVELRPASPG
jgi:predicted nicotinamide N-methyase